MFTVMLSEELLFGDLFPCTTLRAVEEVVTIITVFLQSLVLHVMTTMLAGSPMEPTEVLEHKDSTGKEDYQTDGCKDAAYNV